MEKEKITMKSSVAATNLLKALHSLYQFGHFCDVTVCIDCPGSQEDFFVHKAVLAASSNYFKSLFLEDETPKAKRCSVTLQDVDAKEFVSFLKFVYTAEVEMEVDRLHRMKVVAERLECKDLLDALEQMNAEGQKESDLSVCLNRPERPLCSQDEQRGDQERDNLPQILATPMKRKLWDRKKHRKVSVGCDFPESKFGQLDRAGVALGEHEDEKVMSPGQYKGETPKALDIAGVIQEENASFSQVASSCILNKTFPGQKEHRNRLPLSGAELRKSPRSVSGVLPQTYACDMCDRSFRLAKQYQSHMEREHCLSVAVKYSCHVCGQLFASCQSLKRHGLAAHRDEPPFPCLSCNKKFQHQKDMDDHIQRAHRKKRKPQQCPYCNKVISSRCGLTVHIRTHTGEKPYKCEYCPASFAQKSSFNTHMRKIHESGQDRKRLPGYWMMAPPSGKVDTAGGAFNATNKAGVEVPNADRQRESMGEKTRVIEKELRSLAVEAESGNQADGPEQCDESAAKGENIAMAAKGEEGGNQGTGAHSISDQESLSLEEDDDHPSEEENDEDDDHPSEEENELSSGCETRNGNKNKVTKRSAYVITCNECAEQFVSRKKYVDHCKDVHHALPGKAYQCDVCSKSFASYNSWKEHRACVHSEDRQFACTLCNATFKRKRDVRTHYVRKHEGRVKRPLCSVCGKILSSRTALVFHMRTHTGEKPYQCGICFSRFAQPSQLKIHTRMPGKTRS